MEQPLEVLIIGGGVSGIACAREIVTKTKNFAIITKDIGGRIKQSKDKTSNYGALMVGATYRHILPFVKTTEPVGIGHIQLYDRNLNTIPKKLLSHPFQLVKLVFITHDFLLRYKRFQYASLYRSQKELIEEDPYLNMLYTTPAIDFFQSKKILEVAEDIVSPIVWGITVSSLREQNAFTALLMCLGFFIQAYKFQFDLDAFIHPVKDQIYIGTALTISRKKDLYEIKTEQTTYSTKRIVLATPLDITARLANISNKRTGRVVHIFHIKGQINPLIQKGRAKVFEEGSDIIGIEREPNGTFIVYSLEKEIDLGRYFLKYSIIAEHTWNPIYHAIGTELYPALIKDNMWMVGDANIIGLEDSFITGKYVGQEIIKSMK